MTAPLLFALLPLILIKISRALARIIQLAKLIHLMDALENVFDAVYWYYLCFEAICSVLHSFRNACSIQNVCALFGPFTHASSDYTSSGSKSNYCPNLYFPIRRNVEYIQPNAFTICAIVLLLHHLNENGNTRKSRNSSAPKEIYCLATDKLAEQIKIEMPRSAKWDENRSRQSNLRIFMVGKEDEARHKFVSQFRQCEFGPGPMNECGVEG